MKYQVRADGHYNGPGALSPNVYSELIACKRMIDHLGELFPGMVTKVSRVDPVHGTYQTSIEIDTDYSWAGRQDEVQKFFDDLKVKPTIKPLEDEKDERK